MQKDSVLNLLDCRSCLPALTYEVVDQISYQRHFMKRIAQLFLFALASITSFAVYSEESTGISQGEPVAPINTKEDFAVHGYDAVSYFADGKPQVGSAKYEYEWQGVRWRFVSAAHRDSFKANPERYAPQFGGYCSLAVSRGITADGDPEQWAVVDGKLFLNNNPRAQALWDQDRPGNISLGKKNWPLIPKKPNAAAPKTAVK
jgi:YHS domain-containing protein